MRSLQRAGLLVLTLLLALAPAAAVRGAGPSLTEEQLLEKIERGGTAEDHAALASYYRAQAKAMEEKAALHETMATKYATAGKGDWPTHCRNLASYYGKLATEYEDLAKLHDARAAELRGK